jgi:hypothetical protein
MHAPELGHRPCRRRQAGYRGGGPASVPGGACKGRETTCARVERTTRRPARTRIGDAANRLAGAGRGGPGTPRVADGPGRGRGRAAEAHRGRHAAHGRGTLRHPGRLGGARALHKGVLGQARAGLDRLIEAVTVLRTVVEDLVVVRPAELRKAANCDCAAPVAGHAYWPRWSSSGCSPVPTIQATSPPEPPSAWPAPGFRHPCACRSVAVCALACRSEDVGQERPSEHIITAWSDPRLSVRRPLVPWFLRTALSTGRAGIDPARWATLCRMTTGTALRHTWIGDPALL